MNTKTFCIGIVLILFGALPIVAAQCSSACQPIVKDGLFQTLGTNVNKSEWKIQPNNTLSISITDTPIKKSNKLYTRGYNFVVFQSSLDTSRMYQTMGFPALPAGKSLWLEFYLLVQSSGVSSVDTLTLSIDDVEIASFNAFYIFTTDFAKQRYNVSQFADGRNHTLAFSISSTAQSATQFYLDTVSIYPLYNNLLAQTVYVSNSGNDLLGTGSSSSPFCSVKVGLESIAPSSILRIQTGTYCDHALEIPRSQITLAGYGTALPVFNLQNRWGGFSLASVSGITFISIAFAWGRTRPNILITNSSDVVIYNCQFQNMSTTGIYSYFANSAVGIWDSTQIQIRDCYFSNVSDYATFAQDSDCYIYDTVFDKVLNTVTSRNAEVMMDYGYILNNPKSICMNFISSEVTFYTVKIVDCVATYRDSEVTIENCEVYQQTFGVARGIIVGDNSTLRMIGSEVSGFILPVPVIQLTSATSQAYFNDTLFDNILFTVLSAADSAVHFKNCNFSQIGISPWIPVILVTENSYAYFDTCFFNHTHDCITAIKSTVYVTSSEFTTIFILYGSTFTAIDSNITITNSKWYICIGAFSAGINARRSLVTIENTTFDQVTGLLAAGALFLDDFSVAYIENSIFINSFSKYMIFARNTNLTISSCYAYNNTGSVAGFALIGAYSSTTIINSTIAENTGQRGGAFFLSGELTVINSTLSKNYASFQGGVVNVAPSFMNDVSPPSVTFYGNDIYGNEATFAGGVIYMERGISTFADYGNKYANNSAREYGDIIATDPSHMYIFQVPPARATPGITSLGEFQVLLLDQLNASVWVGATVYLKIGDTNIASAYFNKSGVANFDPNTIVYGKPGTTTTFMLYSSLVGVAYRSYPLVLESCPPGWVPEENQCTPCPPGTYGYNGITCVECPENAICDGGYYVETLSGYWYNTTIVPFVLYKCPYHCCAGNNSCEEHHTGPVCAVCEPGYYNWGVGCVACEKISTIFIVVAIVAAIALILWNHKSASSSGRFSIILFFAQTMVAFSSHVQFGYLSLINFQLGTTSSSSSSGSFLQTTTFCPGQFDFYERHYFTYFVPPILFGMVLVGFGVQYILVKLHVLASLNTARELGSLVGLFSMLYFPVTKNAYSILFCTNIAHTSVLNSNIGVECSGHQYHTAVKVAAAVLAVTSIVPLCLAILLTRMKNKLDQEHIQRIWGGFYLQYKPEFYFWASVNMILQYALSVVLNAPLQSDLQSFLLLLVVLAILTLQLIFQPFTKPTDNQLSTVSLALLSIYASFLDNGETNTWQFVVLLCGISFAADLLYQIIRGKCCKDYENIADDQSDI